MSQRLFLLAGLVLLVGASSVEAQPDETVVGRVGDVEVTMADLDDAWRQNDASNRMRMLQDLYDTRRRVLDIVVGEILIEREAIERGLSRDELLAQELPARTLPVTDEEIALLYGQNQNAFGGRTLEQMKPEIRAFLEQQRPTQALHGLMAELREAADDIALDLEPPRTPVEVSDEDPSFGPADAPVQIVEFSDFQCPYCQQLTGTIDELKEIYGDDVRVVFKDYPLPNHPQAFKAAEAGLCANLQGKFWELHDRMFDSQDALEVADIKRYAGELGVDQAAFDTCLDSGQFSGDVNADLRAGQDYGVSSTPTVFINGRTVLGAAPIALFQQIIDEELERSRR
ncbi:MAG: hypothetical protein CL441_06400 [Acidimicrobiaceae bacterium]|nr:hypothetical protein [Acidimicrobiaceae bacterium]